MFLPTPADPASILPQLAKEKITAAVWCLLLPTERPRSMGA